MGMRPAERRDLKALAVLPGELAGRSMTEAEDRLRFCEGNASACGS